MLLEVGDSGITAADSRTRVLWCGEPEGSPRRAAARAGACGRGGRSRRQSLEPRRGGFPWLEPPELVAKVSRALELPRIWLKYIVTGICRSYVFGFFFFSFFPL